jgi:hypothetical protein
MVGSLPELRERVCQLAAELSAVHGAFAEALADFERAEGHIKDGHHSVGQWLSFFCGMSPRMAGDLSRTAARLSALPTTGAALCAGEVSWSKARSIARVATPATEASLLYVAEQATGSQFERITAALSTADEAEARVDAQAAHAARAVRWYHDRNAMRFTAVLPVEDGEAVARAIDQAMAAVAERTDPLAARRADGLTALALDHLGGKRPGGRAVPEVVVTVDVNTLVDETPGPCALEDGPALAVATARRLACDARLVTALLDEDGDPLNVGRATRTIPPHIKRALLLRDGGCVFPGCGRTHASWLHGHHICHWCRGGETSLENLITLCRRHHRLLHEDDWTYDPASRTFARPDGSPFLPPRPPPIRGPDERRVAARDPNTLTCRDGWRMDFGFAINVIYDHLANLEGRARRDAA